ncbi:hypothetical protein V2J09_020078 [Rumex salicifolius]
MFPVTIFYIATFLLPLLIALISYKRRTSTSKNVVLPPGSKGFPFIGETLQLIIPSNSLDLPSFIKSRIQKYGPVFQTRLVGRPVVMSADQDFNRYIVQQEGKLVEMWYLDTFSKLFAQEGEGRTNATGLIHKCIRGMTLKHFGSETLKEKLLNQIEDLVSNALENWSDQESIDVKQSALTMVIDFVANQLFGYDREKNSDKIGEKFAFISQGLLSFPINLPGTTYHKCMKNKDEVMNMIRAALKERLASPESNRDDFLDHAIKDLHTQSFLTEDFITQIMFGLLFASSESTSMSLSLVFKFLAENPQVLDEMMAEHETILKNKANPGSHLTWEEVKSMTFTLSVINESLRLGNVSLGLLRKALKDIQYKGFTIPAGWTIMMVTSACQYNSDIYTDPLTFNPRRWKDIAPDVMSKNFMPFGGGTRQCAGAEFAKVLMVTLLHVLMTKYRWTKIKGGDFARTPILVFKNGLHIKVFKKIRNSTIKSVILPPGSQGFPLIGETLQLITPSFSLDQPSFIKSRIQKYGSVFQTRLAGRPVVMSADPEFNRYIVQQEGKLVELWYLETFSKLFVQEGKVRTNATGLIHKFIRGMTLKHFGSETLKEKLLNKIEELVNNTLENWSSQESIDVKDATLTMIIDFVANHVFGFDWGNNNEKIGKKFGFISQGLFSFPINIPGTNYHKCMKYKEEVITMIRAAVKERLISSEFHKDDFLDHALRFLHTEDFLTEEFIIQIMFGLLFASSDTTKMSLTLVFKFLTEHPLVLDEMMAEHERIMKNKKNPGSPLNWNEVKSMTFTLRVINESLRLGNVSLGLLRKALQDIHFNGYTIPAGWTIMVLTSARHYNPDVFSDPHTFNPWRWKDLKPDVVSKNFTPFGGGTRQCAGAEFAKIMMVTFLHVLMTKYWWSKIKGGEIARTPIIVFKKGLHIKVVKKEN